MRIKKIAGAALAVMTIGLAGCAAQAATAHSASAGAASGTTRTTADQVTAASPGSVALSYADALFAGKFATASLDVVPASRNAFLALTDGLKPGAISAKDVAAASTVIASNGKTAVVVITGSVCESGSCVTNTSVHSTSSFFTIRLAKQSDGDWLVDFVEPATQSTPSSVTATAPAPAS